MTVSLFGGIAVSDLDDALPWYERLLGEVSFKPHDKEAVWEIAENRSLYILEDPGRSGHAIQTIFLETGEEFEAMLAAIADRGLEPESTETYGNGVRKTTFRDPEGNEIGIGGPPLVQ